MLTQQSRVLVSFPQDGVFGLESFQRKITGQETRMGRGGTPEPSLIAMPTGVFQDLSLRSGVQTELKQSTLSPGLTSCRQRTVPFLVSTTPDATEIQATVRSFRRRSCNTLRWDHRPRLRRRDRDQRRSSGEVLKFDEPLTVDSDVHVTP